MKVLRFFIIALFAFSNFHASAQTGSSEQEKLNLPGDNLNLYAALKLFQESKTLEAFERSLNDSTTKINNLDLDGDEKIDYIRVVDKPDGDVHNIIMKVAINKDEEQDVAVFVVNKKDDGQAHIQLIGDEDLYGKDYIIEPNTGVATAAGETANPGYSATAILANGETVPIQTTTAYEVASWPVVQYIYIPTYSAWQSPWHWDYYPDYWRPWRPHYWHYYYGYQFNYQPYYYQHYRRWNQYRVPGWYGNYYGGNSYRSRSAFVQRRYQQGYYRRTYQRPASARNGASAFRRDNPQVQAVRPLPKFNNSGQPVPVQPTPGVRPVKTKPDITAPGTRPVKPVRGQGIKPSQPSVSEDQPIKPVKPVRAPGIKPTPPVSNDQPVKPVRPVREPGVNPVRPVPALPSPKPVRPVRPVTSDQPAPAPVRPTRQQGVKPMRPVEEVRTMTPRTVPVRREPSQPRQQAPLRKTREN